MTRAILALAAATAVSGCDPARPAPAQPTAPTAIPHSTYLYEGELDWVTASDPDGTPANFELQVRWVLDEVPVVVAWEAEAETWTLRYAGEGFLAGPQADGDSGAIWSRWEGGVGTIRRGSLAVDAIDRDMAEGLATTLDASGAVDGGAEFRGAVRQE